MSTPTNMTATRTATIPARSTGSLADHDLTVARSVGAVGLAGIALIHLLDLPSKMSETPYLGVGYLALILAALTAAGMLVLRHDPRAWLLGGAVAASALGGYVISRTTGLPAATGDIGNWLEPLGLASLFVEGVVIVLAAAVVNSVGAVRRLI